MNTKDKMLAEIKEHLGGCDFLIEANKNATINKFESVIKEVLQTKTNE